MDTNGWTCRAVALALLLVAAAGGTPSRAAAARGGQGSARSLDVAANDLSACAGTYVVKRKPLIDGKKASDGDAVVLEVAGTLAGTPPLVTVRSGCATSSATLEAKHGGTLVTADLMECGGAPGTVHLRALIDGECLKMKGSLRAPRSGKGSKVRRFTARRAQTLVGDVISGRVSARHGAEVFSLTRVSVSLHRRPGGEQTAAVESDQIGNFALPDQPVGSYDVCARAEGFVPACASEPVELGTSANAYREIELVPFGGALHGRVLLVDGSPCFQPATPFDGGVTATVNRVGGAPSRGDSAARYLVMGFRGPGTYSLEVTCGESRVTTSVTVGHDELAGINAVDLTIPNNPPSITLLAASLNGVGVRSAAPGSTLDVSAEVADADGDTLHYAWIDGPWWRDDGRRPGSALDAPAHDGVERAQPAGHRRQGRLRDPAARRSRRRPRRLRVRGHVKSRDRTVLVGVGRLSALIRG